MNWLNIHTSTLRTPEFISSEPVERATWLCVLSYSAEQENGGRLSGAALWTDRQWQQACGVTREEVRQAVRLLRIDGDDVLVAFYPEDKQKEVQARRLSGRNGGLRSGEARSKLSLKQKGSTPSRNASTEGNEKEKEGNSAPSAGMPSAERATPEANLQNAPTAISDTNSRPSAPDSTGRLTVVSEATQGETSGIEDSAGSPPSRPGVFPTGRDDADGQSQPPQCEQDAPPCALEEALQFCRSIGYPDSVTKAWYLHRESVDWKRGTAVSIRKWQPDLELWIKGEERRNPDAFKATKAEPHKTASGETRKTIDPEAFARWAATFSKPPQLEGASDRLVERFRRESAAACSAPSEGKSEKGLNSTCHHRPSGARHWSEAERKAA